MSPIRKAEGGEGTKVGSWIRCPKCEFKNKLNKNKRFCLVCRNEIIRIVPCEITCTHCRHCRAPHGIQASAKWCWFCHKSYDFTVAPAPEVQEGSSEKKQE